MLIRAILAFLALPGIFAGILPWALSCYDPWYGKELSVGFIPASLGLLMLLWCVRDFYVAGKGTLAPWSPPKYLVTNGLYRYTRNPMYLSVLFIIAGWGLVKGSPIVAFYLLFFTITFHLRVLLNEELWLSEQFEQEWTVYSNNVPRWIPKFTGLR